MPDFLKKMKRPLYIGLAGGLLVALIGAVSVWLFYIKPARDAAEAAVAPPALHKEPFQTLWPLEKMDVSLSGRMGERTLTLGFSFDLDSDALAPEMEQRKDEIMEALGLAFAGRSVEEMERSGSKVRLKYEALRLVNGLLSGGRVKGVYITEFLIL